MKTQQTINSLQNRIAPIEMSSDDFRTVGHKLIDTLADFLTSLP